MGKEKWRQRKRLSDPSLAHSEARGCRMWARRAADKRPTSATSSWSWRWRTSYEPKIPAARTCHKGELHESRAAPSRRLLARSLKIFALDRTSSTHFTFLQTPSPWSPVAQMPDPQPHQDTDDPTSLQRLGATAQMTSKSTMSEKLALATKITHRTGLFTDPRGRDEESLADMAPGKTPSINILCLLPSSSLTNE